MRVSCVVQLKGHKYVGSQAANAGITINEAVPDNDAGADGEGMDADSLLAQRLQAQWDAEQAQKER